MAASKKSKISTTFQIPESEAEELMTDEELDERAESKAKRSGRPRNENWLPWEEAKEFIRGEQIASRGQYEKWWEREKPKTISRFPYRVYKNEWVSWNDFLGNNNAFNEKTNTKWRPLLDALPYIHSLKITSQREWLEYYRLNKETAEFPSDIPARPDLVYPDWRSWGHWLGNKPIEAIQARQEAQRVQIYYIIHRPGDPGNVFYVGIDANPTAFRERLEYDNFAVVKTYWYDQTKGNIAHQIINEFSSMYMDQERQRLCPNIYDITWHLDQLFDPVRRGQV